MTLPINPEPEWLQILRADAQATGSISQTARRVGVSRPAISQILNGIGHYGSGRASTAKVAEKVMNTIGKVVCPFLSSYHATEHKITGLRCREYAVRATAPTNSPREMQHWLACQGCAHRADQVTTPHKCRSKADRSLTDEPLQQAGVIDTRTLPLPVIGPPQIKQTQEVA